MFSEHSDGQTREQAGSHLSMGGLLFENLEEGDTDNTPPGDRTLEDAARREREYVKNRLREELGREPGEAELNEWLRQHTEGH